MKQKLTIKYEDPPLYGEGKQYFLYEGGRAVERGGLQSMGDDNLKHWKTLKGAVAYVEKKYLRSFSDSWKLVLTNTQKKQLNLATKKK